VRRTIYISPSEQSPKPRPLPGWLQAAFVLLLLSQVLHEPSFSANAAPGTSPPASVAYVYEPAGVTAAASAQAAFPYRSVYAHAAPVQLTSVQAYDPTPGPWLARDRLPAQ
jgi:hypothetical protein